MDHCGQSSRLRKVSISEVAWSSLKNLLWKARCGGNEWSRLLAVMVSSLGELSFGTQYDANGQRKGRCLPSIGQHAPARRAPLRHRQHHLQRAQVAPHTREVYIVGDARIWTSVRIVDGVPIRARHPHIPLGVWCHPAAATERVLC